MKSLVASLLFLLGIARTEAQTQTWQSYFIGSHSTPAPIVLGSAIIDLSSEASAPNWAGTLSSAPTSSYNVIGFGKDNAGNLYTLYTQQGASSAINTSIPLGYISKIVPLTGATQFFGISGVEPQLLGVSPLGYVFIVGFDESKGTNALFQLGATGQLTSIFQFSITYFDVGNGLPGPMTVDENNDISIAAVTQLGAGTFSPAEFLFVTTGPVPAALPLAPQYGAGSNITLQATASLPISYQWNLNGAVIPGATSSSFTPSNQGEYSVTASTVAGSVSLNTIVNAPFPVPAGQLVNISCRAYVGTGSNIGIAGFVVSGTANEQVLIRGVGPTLSEFSVGGVLAQPVLTVFNSTGTEIASNVGWGTNSNAAAISAAFATAGAFVLPIGSADSALLLSLAPGAYTAQVSGLNNTTGDALIEVYQIAQTAVPGQVSGN